MMGKTHIFIGTATALVIASPLKLGDICATIIGGTLGGIISDIDVESNGYCRDALYARLIAVGITAIASIIDFFWGKVMCTYLINSNKIVLGIGCGIILLVCIIARCSAHRTFSHSLLFLALLSAGIGMICPVLLLPFVFGFISHILLDLLNKKPVSIFFPAKGFCLNWCYADGVANTVFMILGLIITIGYIVLCIIASFG